MGSAFGKLARPIQKWIRQQGWRELRDIQVRAIRSICDSETDLIVAASTAGGKTEAAFLPLISQVLNTSAKRTGFDLLYIGPLKALITDQAGRLKNICREVELPVVPWHGDVSQSAKMRALKAPRGILLITPESLEALFIRRGLEIPRLFGAIRAVVIDELHTVLDSERGIQLRSLLTRLEFAIKRPIRRIGLSATLGDMEMACLYLRPDQAGTVDLIKAEGREPELKLQLRGYVNGGLDEKAISATRAIASHIFQNLRGTDNLVFAGARQVVEIYADRLRERCERERLPQEFYPHHANLSREHRTFVERRLKNKAKPTTAICTSTLELGIDIGAVTCVAHIGAPFSVAALRQRLGRSGRREGQPAILRQYAVEARLEPKSSNVDRLRLGLVRSIAIIELLLEGWCEPPKPRSLHLSTLVHQILSVIAERGGSSASHLFGVLCRNGPFRQVSAVTFADILRALGAPGVGLIEQTERGLLLLGPTGERLVEHYSFYAVFKTPEEFRLVSSGRDLGTLPIHNVLSSGMMLIFSGRRWLVEEVHDRDKVIAVKPAKAGTVPKFSGDPGEIHDKIIKRMFDMFEGAAQPIYMDIRSLEMLTEARLNYSLMGFRDNPVVRMGRRESIVATRVGTVKTTTLALALRAFKFRVQQHDGFLIVETGDETVPLSVALERIASGEDIDLLADAGNLAVEKFHPYLSNELLELDALSSRLSVRSLVDLANSLVRR